jgi:DNA polymerase III subunit gamma/tau
VALALYRKYRPRTFAEVIGQEHVTEPLSQALRSGRLHHAYLFSGPRGCGKTSSARILARSLNCEQGPTPEPCGVCASCKSLANDGAGSIDVIEIDAASHGGVDDARELREKAFFAPVSSRYKIYVIDEAHMVSSAGFNALLKLVEEPPDYVKFIFATTEPEKVLGTIKSRTHHYPFRLIPPAVLRPYLQQLTEAEGVRVEPAVFPLVVRAGGGSARDSLSVLDQLIAGAGPEGVTYARAVSLLGVTDVTLIDEMCDALAAGDGAAAYATIDRVAEAGHDPRRFASDLLERFRDLIIMQQVPDAVAKGLIDGPTDQLDAMSAQATRLGPATLSRCADIVHNGLVEMRGTTAPRLLLELITARMLLPGADDSAGALLQRLERMERRLTLSADPADGVRPQSAPATHVADPSGGDGSSGGISAARAAAVTARHAPAEQGSAGAWSASGEQGSTGGRPLPSEAGSPAARQRSGDVGSPASATGSPAPGEGGSPASATGSPAPGEGGLPASATGSPAPGEGGLPASATGSPAPGEGGSPASATGSPAPGEGGLPASATGSPAPGEGGLPASATGRPASADGGLPAPVTGLPASGESGEPSSGGPRRPEPLGVLPDAPEEPGAAVAIPGAPGQLSAAAIREVWPEIITTVGRQSKKVAALASGATVRDLDGETVVLTFRFPAHAKMVASEPELIANALYEALGGRWQIRCEVAGEAGGVQSPPGTSGAASARSVPAQKVPTRSAAKSAPSRQREVATPAATRSDDEDWPEPARPGGAVAGVPDSDIPGTGGLGAGRPGSGSPGSGGLGAGNPGSDSPGSGSPGSARPGSARPGSARPESARPESGGPGQGPPAPSGPGSGGPGSGIPGMGDTEWGGVAGDHAASIAHPTGSLREPGAGGGASATAQTAGGTTTAQTAGDTTAGLSAGDRPVAGGAAASGAPGAVVPSVGAVARTSSDPGNGGLAAARAAAAEARNGNAARTGVSRPAAAEPEPGPDAAARSDAWSDGSPAEEPPYDPDYDGPLRAGTARYEGFDPGDEPLDDVIDEKTARQSSEQQAMQLLQDAFGAEKIGES